MNIVAAKSRHKQQKTEIAREYVVQANDLYFDKLSRMLCKEECIVAEVVKNSASDK